MTPISTRQRRRVIRAVSRAIDALPPEVLSELVMDLWPTGSDLTREARREYQALRPQLWAAVVAREEADHLEWRALWANRPEMLASFPLPYVPACCECETKQDLTLDHCTPLSRGGSNDLDNLVIMCASCNRQKGALTYLEWLARQLITGVCKLAVVQA